MELYHRLYLICLAGMGAGLILCGILFVKLEIRTAWRVLSGRRDPKARREKPEKKRTFPLYRREKEEGPKTVLLPKRERKIQKSQDLSENVRKDFPAHLLRKIFPDPGTCSGRSGTQNRRKR